MKAFRTIAGFLLDTIAPPDPKIRRIERMSPSAFVSEALRVDVLPGLPEIISVLPYRSNPVRTALVELKERPNREIARILGAVLYDALAEEAADAHVFGGLASPLVAPIPIGRRRRRERGYNQCEFIMEGMRWRQAELSRASAELLEADESAAAGVLTVFEYHADALVRTRESEDQVGKSRAGRLENLRGAFRARHPASMLGRNIIVFDDIATTGATLLSARETLLAAGARRVLLASVAH